MSAGPIRTVTVVGGGITAWSAAAALRRRGPSLAVSVLPLPVPDDALADRIGCTLPSALGFHADCGLRQDDAVLRTGSLYRLGTLHEGWVRDRPPYVHSYGRHGHPLPGGSFHLHWIRMAGTAPRAAGFDQFSPAAALGREGRFLPADGDGQGPLGGYEHGLQLDVGRYAAMMRAFARHHGVADLAGELAGVRVGEDGAIAALALDGGREHRADLYVDASGPQALLRGALDARRDDWGRWLPCDRVLMAGDATPPATPPVLDRVVATGAGWRWSSACAAQGLHGQVYASAHASDATAARQLRVATSVEASAAPARVAAGTRPEPWRANCVAIGDAATAIEPLEWCNLHLVHSAIDRLLFMLPDRDFAPVELADYNRQHLAEAERVRDFVLLHYATARRPEPLWRAAATTGWPASLAHSLALFRERGRLPFYEEETFARDSWLAVLLGQGVLPRRVDPLVEAIAPADADRALAGMLHAIAAAVPAAPTHAAFLAAQTRQMSR